MSDISDQGENVCQELYSHHGVLLKHHKDFKEEDTQCPGTLSVIDCNNGKYIEWKPTEVSVDSDDQEWAMVTTGGRRTRTTSGSVDSQTRSRPLRIPISELKSFRVTKRGQQLTFMQNEGVVYCIFFFHNGNADCFVNALRGNVKTAMSRKDKNLYMILNQRESQVLDRSFAELDIFTENKSDYVWKFVKDFHSHPYETTMGAFSKLTDAWLYGRTTADKRMEDEVAELLHRSWTTDEPINNVGPDEYEVIGTVPVLPPRPPAPRGNPLTIDQWARYQDEEGRVREVDTVKEIIFRGGIAPGLRYEVWKYLLGYYPWDSTSVDRQNLRKQKTEEYFRMKLQWRTISPAQEERFADFRDRKSLIEKDVNRTDRTIPFFAGENNPNLQLLYDILMTYVMYNFDLGYVQGMSDLLSPILCLMTNEVDAFWCFVGFMERVSRNFDLDQSGMKQQLGELQCLLSAVDPELSSYIHQRDSGNMFFCFRWLLVLFKREFSQSAIMKLWEVLWTDLPCPNFHLLLCVAILDTEKVTIMEGNYGFTEILKHINDLSLKIDLNATISKAEGIYHQLMAAAQLPDPVRLIIGLEPLGDLGNGVNGSLSQDRSDSVLTNAPASSDIR
ncbi:TBC1 domain family member 15 isoform X2 [Anabrus simplex]|uniref:TBC1 domain family member 15 isoform X2 n=1 Tax=Anabrus simplex TaxID=316456 RepID=UPI0035A2C43C